MHLHIIILPATTILPREADPSPPEGGMVAAFVGIIIIIIIMN
jgi:hypothetical protein